MIAVIARRARLGSVGIAPAARVQVDLARRVTVVVEMIVAGHEVRVRTTSVGAGAETSGPCRSRLHCRN